MAQGASRASGSRRWSTSTRTCSWRSSPARALKAAQSTALRLANKISPYWNSRGMYGMGRERLGAALRLPGAESPTLERAAALASMGDFAWKQGALAEARACFEESLTLSRNAGDLARHYLGAQWPRDGEHPRARP